MKRHYQSTYHQHHSQSWKTIIALIIAVCIMVSLLFFNRTRLQLLFKGYGLSSQNIILSLDDEQQDEYLSLRYAIDIESWDKLSHQKHYYDYDYYQNLNQDITSQDVISYVDGFYEIYETSLSQLGYDLTKCRELMPQFSLNDWKFLSQKQYHYQDIVKYLEIKGYVIEDIPQYMSSQKEALDAVLSVSYPFIDAQKKVNRTYQIENPDNYLVLIKKGFVLNDKYEPSDLVKVNIPNAPDNENDMLRKDASEALTRMYEAALKEDLHLVLNSGYRSYQQQKEIYDEYFRIYDEVTASGLVAVPGSSEHQLGLGVDLTSQSVLDGERMVFGDTVEYQWVIKHAYEYGFILRYPVNQSSLTGTVNEPWHLRYVGIEAAKEIYEHHWTLENYILQHGFTYDLSIQ